MGELEWIQRGKEHHLYRNDLYKGKVERIGFIVNSYFNIYNGVFPMGSDKSLFNAKMKLEKKIQGDYSLGEIVISIKKNS